MQVLNVLLQLLDDGRLTDGQGRTVDFSNTVIILTSNLGAHVLLDSVGAGDRVPEGTQQEVMKIVRKHFSPEFLNRLDDIVFFRPLVPKDLRKICKIQVMIEAPFLSLHCCALHGTFPILFHSHCKVATLDERLKDRDISVVISDDAADVILRDGYVPAFGARPLRRYIEKHIVSAISRLLLAGELTDHSNVLVDVDAAKTKLVFRAELREERKRTTQSDGTM